MSEVGRTYVFAGIPPESGVVSKLVKIKCDLNFGCKLLLYLIFVVIFLIFQCIADHSINFLIFLIYPIREPLRQRVRAGPPRPFKVRRPVLDRVPAHDVLRAWVERFDVKVKKFTVKVKRLHVFLKSSL